ncbi:MAG: histidinol dehydrogenase [Rickettsiales bacterium]|nr:histidinol dehydrogenase [Rickettsiales bacterium]
MLKKLRYKIDASLKDIEKLFSTESLANAEISNSVSEIINDVKTNGNKALFNYTKKFDNFEINENNLRISSDEIEKSAKNVDKEFLKSAEIAYSRIKNYHERQLPIDEKFKDNEGNQLGWKWNAVDSVAIYVPGGKALYPSSVLMNAVPALVAGVKRIVMLNPTPNGILNPSLLACAKICGISEIYRIGGAQAISAVTYGTETIEKVVKIVGPGNSYVAEAKKQVFGSVGIDSIAGPSEILVIADASANAKYIAADLLSQAEHDELARAILVTNSNEFAEKISKEIEVMIEKISRTEIASQSIKNNGYIILVEDIEDAAEIANIIAPEHLEIITADPEKLSRKIHNAGAIFLGEYTPEAIGDYIAGPSHVLPTMATAKFSSGLGVLDFMKRTSMIKCTKESFDTIAPHAMNFAKQEKLDAHGLSVKLRIN